MASKICQHFQKPFLIHKISGLIKNELSINISLTTKQQFCTFLQIKMDLAEFCFTFQSVKDKSVDLRKAFGVPGNCSCQLLKMPCVCPHKRMQWAMEILSGSWTRINAHGVSKLIVGVSLIHRENIYPVVFIKWLLFKLHIRDPETLTI